MKISKEELLERIELLEEVVLFDEEVVDDDEVVDIGELCLDVVEIVRRHCSAHGATERAVKEIFDLFEYMTNGR